MNQFFPPALITMTTTPSDRLFRSGKPLTKLCLSYFSIYSLTLLTLIRPGIQTSNLPLAHLPRVLPPRFQTGSLAEVFFFVKGIVRAAAALKETNEARSDGHTAEELHTKL